MTQYYGYQEKSFLTKMKEEGEGKGEGRRKWSTRRRKREGRRVVKMQCCLKTFEIKRSVA